jgi:RNA polymerase sigma factor (TIGR02999 family)
MKSAQPTELIRAWQAGDSAAFDLLIPHVYAELHQLANAQMRREQGNHTLQATALVNEAFLRLADIEIDFQNRSHFLAMAATAMRRVLVDHARRKKSAKRGGNLAPVTLDEESIAAAGESPDVLDLDRALTQLAAVDARLASCVELVFFGGLTYEEAAAALGVSKTTVFDELTLAKAWLKKAMADRSGPDDQ